MRLENLSLNTLKQFDPNTGLLNQLSYSEEKGWEVVGLSSFQRNFLKKLPSFILHLFGLSHVANTQSSYLYQNRFKQTGDLTDGIKAKVNALFHRTFYHVAPQKSPLNPHAAPSSDPINPNQTTMSPKIDETAPHGIKKSGE